MMTLREFVEKVNFYEHFRVYQPNRDCLIYESFFTTHSPYYFDNGHEPLEYNRTYYENNHYCRNARFSRELDDETKIFLDRFGDYEVFSLECSCFRPCDISIEEDGHIKIESVKDESMSSEEYIGCFNVFIK